MTAKRFEYVRTQHRHYIHDTKKDGEFKKGHRGTYDEFDLEKISDLLNALHEHKTRCCANSHNAHNFLRCYEKAINDLTEEYRDNPIAKEVLKKLDEYYDKYEQMVELE